MNDVYGILALLSTRSAPRDLIPQVAPTLRHRWKKREKVKGMVVPSQFKLQTVAAELIERLEGTRRAYAGRPDEARATFLEIGEETARLAAGECRTYTGNDPYPELLVEEIRRTFVPRYADLAVEQTALERSGYGTWRSGDVLFRLLAGLGSVLLAALLMRVAPGLLKDLVWLAVPVAIFLPELRGLSARLRYRRELQSIVVDMARVQKHMESFSWSDPARELPETLSADDAVERWKLGRSARDAELKHSL